jgi:hypothetical protein
VLKALFGADAVLKALGGATAIFAAFVGTLYVVGALVLGVRLGLGHLPSSAVVAQLPRDFLLSIGLTAVLPGLVLGGIVAGCLTFGGDAARGAAPVAFAAVALVACVVIAALFAFKDPFPARVCSVDGAADATGVFIGETQDRIYIGDAPDRPGRHNITSVPLSRVARVFIGGGAAEARCGRTRT